MDFELKNLATQKRNKILEFEAITTMLKNADEYYESVSYVQKREFAKILGLNIQISPQNKLNIAVPEGINELFFNNGGGTWV